MSKITYYHAGCPVCIEAERTIVNTLLGSNSVDVINIGEDKAALAIAKDSGIESVPALVIDGSVFHINFGAAINDLG